MTVDQCGTTVRIERAHDSIKRGTLAGAGWTDESDRFTVADSQANIIKYAAFWFGCECVVAQFNFLPNWRKFVSADANAVLTPKDATSGLLLMV